MYYYKYYLISEILYISKNKVNSYCTPDTDPADEEGTAALQRRILCGARLREARLRILHRRLRLPSLFRHWSQGYRVHAFAQLRYMYVQGGAYAGEPGLDRV